MMASFSAFGGDFPSIALIVLHSLEGSVVSNCLHVYLRCLFVVLVILSFICCRAGEVGSLDLKSSRALILSNIFAGTDSVFEEGDLFVLSWAMVRRVRREVSL